MDNAAIRCVEDYLHMGLPVEAGALLIIEVDGAPGAIAQDILEIQNICLANRALEAKAAKDDQEAEELWKARRAVSPAVVKLNPTKINEDITVPRSKVAEILHRVEAIAKKHNLIIVNFGHAGDGNIHVNVMIDKRRARRGRTSPCRRRGDLRRRSGFGRHPFRGTRHRYHQSSLYRHGIRGYGVGSHETD